ncbi:hypothetical protein ACFPRL_27540 [Pseudoclavibacter helvolus]
MRAPHRTSREPSRGSSGRRCSCRYLHCGCHGVGDCEEGGDVDAEDGRDLPEVFEIEVDGVVHATPDPERGLPELGREPRLVLVACREQEADSLGCSVVACLHVPTMAYANRSLQAGFALD